MSNLQFTINNVLLLKSTQTFGKMENYVLIKAKTFGQIRSYRTSIKQGQAKKKDNENRIIFDETIKLDIPLQTSKECQLQIFVMDEDMGSDQVCGKGKINPANCGLLSGNSGKYTLSLFQTKNNEKAGQLLFTAKYS